MVQKREENGNYGIQNRTSPSPATCDEQSQHLSCLTSFYALPFVLAPPQLVGCRVRRQSRHQNY